MQHQHGEPREANDALEMVETMPGTTAGLICHLHITQALPNNEHLPRVPLPYSTIFNMLYRSLHCLIAGAAPWLSAGCT